ncbi:MAG: SDR family NAD(P)-dependent oxidoreductase [Bacteroidota bacterium]
MKKTGHKIIITGATRGIGKSLMSRFHRFGNKIVAIARNKELLKKLEEDYEGISCIACDLSKPTEVQALIQNLQQNHSDSNILINNAGIQVGFTNGERFSDKPERLSEIADEIQVNFSTPITLSQQLIPLLLQNPNPVLVNESSGLAFVPKKSAPVYCATKAGLHNFTKALRYQYEDTPLKIFEIIPPLIKTDMTKGRWGNAPEPDDLTDQFMKAFEKDQYEVNIGLAGKLRLLHRIFPRVAENKLEHS